MKIHLDVSLLFLIPLILALIATLIRPQDAFPIWPWRLLSSEFKESEQTKYAVRVTTGLVLIVLLFILFLVLSGIAQ